MEQERRTETRTLCADMVEIQWKDRSGKQCKATALLEDICSSGACLQMEAPIPLGVEIAWDSPGQFFAGYVRYCVYREIGYFIGVEFSRSSQWDRRAFTPQHMLDLERLVDNARKRSSKASAATGSTRTRG